jgi:hypothetical protein
MLNSVNMYYIWYGAWDFSNDNTNTILNSFGSYIGHRHARSRAHLGQQGIGAGQAEERPRGTLGAGGFAEGEIVALRMQIQTLKEQLTQTGEEVRAVEGRRDAKFENFHRRVAELVSSWWCNAPLRRRSQGKILLHCHNDSSET